MYVHLRVLVRAAVLCVSLDASSTSQLDCFTFPPWAIAVILFILLLIAAIALILLIKLLLYILVSWLSHCT